MSISGLDKVQAQVKETVLRLPVLLGNHAVNFTKDSFTKQGWRGTVFTPWAQRKNQTKNIGRGILIQSGRLRRSIRILRADAGGVVIGTDVPYAAAHNNGFNGNVLVKAHKRNQYVKAKVTSLQTRRTKTVTQLAGSSQVKSYTRHMNLPRRQFMPQTVHDSPILYKQLEDLVYNELKKIKE